MKQLFGILRFYLGNNSFLLFYGQLCRQYIMAITKSRFHFKRLRQFEIISRIIVQPGKAKLAIIGCLCGMLGTTICLKNILRCISIESY